MNTELCTSASTVAEIADLVRETNAPFEINGTPHLVIPKDAKLQAFPDLRSTPQRITQTIELHTAQSFVDYWARFATGDSIIVFTLKAAKYTAIFDYHEAALPDVGQAGWCQHRAVYACPMTPEWQEWLKHNGQHKSQVDFAYFVEQNADDIRTPPGAAMLEIVTTLKAKTRIEFSKAIRLANGHNELTYNEMIDGKAGASGQLRIPEEITLGITPFQGSAAYEVKARFRYRIHEGKLTMWYDLVRPHKVNEAALADITAKIRDGMAGKGMLVQGSI